eukprot:GHVS01034034.1.p1 GENE.GHVS01034034.1~~GHVS01034034.1.p1  ORF type:complete len:139 (+),score=13.33 GHVS01034034.1:483-899(+)
MFALTMSPPWLSVTSNAETASTCAGLDCCDGILLHTNHYLDRNLSNGEVPTKCSDFRYRRMKQLLEERKGKFDAHLDMKKILRDVHNELFPILRQFRQTEDSQLLVGTVCSIVMDLNNKQMEVLMGNSTGEFQTVFLP